MVSEDCEVAVSMFDGSRLVLRKDKSFVNESRGERVRFAEIDSIKFFKLKDSGYSSDIGFWAEYLECGESNGYLY